ncbi:MAG: hypothetical protein WC756_18605 [Taibaiella sp.]
MTVLNTSKAQQADEKMARRCYELRKGLFISTIDSGKSWIEVERNNDLQTERTEYDECTSRIHWKSDCSYEITIQSITEGLSKDDVGKTFRVTIDKIDGDKYYYTFYDKNSVPGFSGYMKKLR